MPSILHNYGCEAIGPGITEVWTENWLSRIPLPLINVNYV